MRGKATALILVLVVMIIVGVGTTALLQAMISYSQMQVVTIDNTKARYLAEAGIQYAIYQCRNGNFSSPAHPSFSAADIPQGWSINITKTIQSDGSYEVRATVVYPGI